MTPESIEALWRMVPADAKAQIGKKHAQLLEDYRKKMNTFLNVT